MNKKGFTLVELMVVVAIVAILAAVALPMYSSFKQKGKVNTAIKSLTGVTSALQSWHEDNGTFIVSGNWFLRTTGGALKAGGEDGIRVGAGIPEVENMNWILTGGSLEAPTISSLYIGFDFQTGSGCPDSICDGWWRIVCCSLQDKCGIQVSVGTSNDLGMDKPLDTFTGPCNTL